MTSIAYVLPGSFMLTGDGGTGVLLIHDRAEPDDPELDALARSGDYFITLATSLETLAESLPDLSTRTASQLLEKMAHELAYVQRHYSVMRKDHPDDITELH